MAEPFAGALSKLADSGIGVAAAPSGGMGFALTPDGKLPAGVLFPGTAARRIDCGSGTITWPGASGSSNSLTVVHGLGVTPIAVVVADFTDSGLNVFPVFRTSAFSGTNFLVQAATVDGQLPANTATSTITWIAIG